MEKIIKRLQLPKRQYYETHLSIINCFIPNKLTPREIEVLAFFMSLEGDIVEYRFGASAKKLLMKELDLKPQGLSNHMGELFRKEALIETANKKIDILPILLPEKNEQIYMFKLENHGTN